MLVALSTGEEITRGEVPQSGEATIRFEMPGSEVELFAEIEVVMPDAPRDSGGDVAFPDALAYAIEVRADGELILTRECDAIYPRHFDYTLTTDAEGGTRHAYAGRLEECTITAEPGQTVEVTARRVWGMPEFEPYLRQSDVMAKHPAFLFSGC